MKASWSKLAIAIRVRSSLALSKNPTGLSTVFVDYLLHPAEEIADTRKFSPAFPAYLERTPVDMVHIQRRTT
jgi:hypothetical protein